jgi:hypothetical protein
VLAIDVDQRRADGRRGPAGRWSGSMKALPIEPRDEALLIDGAAR